MRPSLMDCVSVVPLLQCGEWDDRVVRAMDPTHRLVLRKCSHLALEEVLRIDRKSIFAPATLVEQRKRWRRMFGNGSLPAVWVPRSLLNDTESHANLREQRLHVSPAPEDPIFDEAFGKPITRESLERAIALATITARLVAEEPETPQEFLRMR
jgi:hypothetical protein